MENESWQQMVESLVGAKRCVAHAWQILDGTDGPADGVEAALCEALSAIDTSYALEAEHASNQGVAAPAEIQAFWEKHQTLPGFASGT